MKQKKLLAALLAAAMTVACLTQAAIAEPLTHEEILAAGDGGKYQDFWYSELEDGTLIINKYDGKDDEVVIPSRIYGKRVTVIGYRAFAGHFITKVTIPDSVTTIGNSAFTSSEFTELTIPDSVTTIGENAFEHCSLLTEITFSNSLTTIGKYAFYKCEMLTEITIPDSVKTIGDYTFSKCSSLKKITIPAGVTTIGEGAIEPGVQIYGQRGSYAETYAKENSIAFIDPDLTLTNEPTDIMISAVDWTLPEGADLNVEISSGENYLTYYNIYITVDGKQYPFGGATEIYIPLSSWGKNMQAHIENADGNEITNTKLDFNGTMFTVFTVDNSGTYIVSPAKSVPQGSVFAGLTFETAGSFRNNINQSDAYLYIDESTVSVCPNWSVNDVEITDNGTYTVSFEKDLIPFKDGSTEETWYMLTLQTNIEPYIQPDLNIVIDSVKIDGKEIESGKDAELTTRHLYVDEYSDVYGYLPEDYNTEYGMEVYAVVLCNSWEALHPGINRYDFGERVEVTFTVSGFNKRIGAYKNFMYEELDDGTLSIIKYNGKDAEVTVPSEIRGKKVTAIGEQAFYGCSSLTEVTIPDSVTEIGKNVFGWCQLLTKVDLPKNLTAIPEGMFQGCYSLTEITIPDSVTIIGDYAFSDTSLTSINLPDGLTTIGDGAFGGTSLTGINLPDGLTTIGKGAFRACTSLTEIIIPDSVTEIKEEAFIYCYSLEKVKLPKSITTIEYATFFNSNLPEIEIPDNVQSIESRAFFSCHNLKKAVISPYVKTISDYAFSNNEWFGCPDLTIYGYTSTSAESYAKGANIPFVSFGIFLNSDIGVSVTADNGVIPDDTKLNVEQTDKTDTSVSYNITLTQNGKEIQPNDNVTVRIPVPDGWSGKQIYAYYKDANGNLTDMHAVVSGNYIIFTTNHFSEYLLSTTKLVATTPCDVDGSGEVDELDSVALARYLASWDVSIDQSAADVDGNGDIDELDSVMLARKLAGWNV